MSISPLHATNLEIIAYLLSRHPELRAHIQNILDESASTLSLIQPLIKKYCQGSGLEIGGGKNPYCNPANTKFLDKFIDNKDASINPDIVSDASSIPVSDETFDYVFSSHVLEHMQDTIGTLEEWLRVLKIGGILFLLLPHGDRTLDKHRIKTSLSHHIQDYRSLGNLPDNSHNEEIREGWSKNEDFEILSIQYKEEWGADVWDFDFRHKNGVIHFHVWTQDEMTRLLQHIGLNILWVCEIADERPDTFIVVARKKDRTPISEILY